MKTKNILRLTAMSILLLAIFTNFTNVVSAAVYTAGADDLKSLGLFLGTNDGYELDREPTRAEAAVMLVRLLGKEAEAKEKNFSHPFTDVSVWAAPYIGYLYENKLANGISGNKFGANDLCSANMFCAFVLRSLGYTEEAADFTYDEAVKFSVELGLVDNTVQINIGYDRILLAGSFIFTRDHCVSIMYHALNAKIKGTETTLIEKLIGDKKVNEKSAQSFISKNDLISEFNRVFDTIKNKPISLERINNNGLMNVSMITDFVVIDSTSALMNVLGIDIYYKAGYEYVELDSQKIKRKMSDDFNAFYEIYNIFYNLKINFMSEGMIASIEKFVSDKEKEIIYKIISIQTPLLWENAVSVINIECICTPQRELRSVNVITKIMEEDEVITETQDKIIIKAIGDNVKIDFPDFSDYVEEE